MRPDAKAYEILGKKFWSRIESMPTTIQNKLIREVNRMISKDTNENDLKDYAYDFVLGNYDRCIKDFSRSRYEDIKDHIAWLCAQGDYKTLNRLSTYLAQKAMVSAESAALDYSNSNQISQCILNYNFLTSEIDNYKSIINEMKSKMIKEGIQQHLKVLRTFDEKDKLNRNNLYRILSKGIINDILDLDAVLHLDLETIDRISIVMEGKNHIDLGYIEHYTIGYGERISFNSGYTYVIRNPEYFHLKNKDKAIDCFIERYISEMPYSPQQVIVSQTLEEIKSTIA